MDGWYPAEYWTTESWPVLQNYQRYLLQVGYVDGLIGRVLRRLDREGLYDRSLIVVVADHGVSFRAGEGRRPVTPNNLADITNIPLFVKYPNQTTRGVDSRLVRSVDILPTIADVLGIRLPWKVDGVSLLGPIPTRDVVVALEEVNNVQSPYDDARLRAARKRLPARVGRRDDPESGRDAAAHVRGVRRRSRLALPDRHEQGAARPRCHRSA